MDEQQSDKDNPFRVEAHDDAAGGDAAAGSSEPTGPIEPVESVERSEARPVSAVGGAGGGAAGSSPRKKRSLWWVLKNTVKEFVDDDAMTFGAAVAFYTALSFAPLLVVLLVGLSLFMGDDAQARLVGQLNQLMGDQAGGVAQQVLQSADQPTLRNWAGVISLVMLVFSATGVFAQLQHALNLMWDVKAKPGAGLMGWVRKRVLSLGMILTIGFLLIVSLAVSTAIQAMLGGPPPEDGSGGGTVGATFWAMLNAVVSVGVFTVLFGLMFRFLPDARVDWGDVWQGALLTAILFTVGKWAIGTYLGMASVGSAYGAAGSLLVLLVWVYYSCLILFIGAEFTQVWAKRSGKPIEPDEHAVALERSTAGA